VKPPHRKPLAMGPPDNERPGTTHSDRVNPEEVRKPPQLPHSAVKPNAADRHLGHYGGAWREGFGHGFRDALRIAARRLPPETWHTLAQLADEYELAGGDR
jgi:hypothetical protein